MKIEKKDRIVINTAEKEAAFTILIGIFLIIFISFAIYLILMYAATPEIESKRLTARTYVPCAYSHQCPDWQICENSFCVPKEGFCYDSKDCNEWERCNSGTKLCFNKPGRCNNDNECMLGEYCNIETHYCIFDPNKLDIT